MDCGETARRASCLSLCCSEGRVHGGLFQARREHGLGPTPYTALRDATGQAQVLRGLSPASTNPCLEVCWHTVKRTTVKLPETLDAILRHEAELRGVPIAVVTRDALEAYLKAATPRQLLAAGAGHSGARDIADRIEEILSSEIAR